MSAWCGVGAATAIAITLFMPIAAPAAQTVYKCKQGDITVFSPQPCGKDAKEVDTSAALRTGTADNKALEQISASVKDSNCRRDAARYTVGAADDRIVAMQRERRALEVELSKANNNLAGATYESGIRTQIAQLQATMSKERSDANSAYRAALAECDKQRDRP